MHIDQQAIVSPYKTRKVVLRCSHPLERIKSLEWIDCRTALCAAHTIELDWIGLDWTRSGPYHGPLINEIAQWRLEVATPEDLVMVAPMSRR